MAQRRNPYQYADPYESGGVTGDLGGLDAGLAPAPAPPAATPPPQAPTPDYSQLGSYAGSMGGFDMNKFDGDESEKYKVGRVFSNFDPNAGITGELLAALNALDIGDFSGSGDRLNVSNARNGARWDNGVGDVIQNYTNDGGGGARWTYLDTAPEAPSAGGGGGSIPGLPAGAGAGPGGAGAGGGYSGGGGGGTSSSGNPHDSEVWSILSGLLNNDAGGINQDILGRRIEGAREGLNRSRDSQTKSLQSILASRGMLGSGNEGAAYGDLEQQLADTYSGAERDIYVDEAQNADDRLMQALSLATGMTASEAQNEIERYKADISRELGLANVNLDRELGLGRLDLDKLLGTGQLGLGAQGQALDWNKFAAQFGLDREKFAADEGHNQEDFLTNIMEILSRGASTSAQGRV